MADLSDLLQQRKALDDQIASHKAESVARVCALMADLGVTAEDLGFSIPSSAAPVGGKAVKKRAVKFRDPATGSTWTGVGQRPRWLQARLAGGCNLNDFLIKS